MEILPDIFERMRANVISADFKDSSFAIYKCATEMHRNYGNEGPLSAGAKLILPGIAVV